MVINTIRSHYVKFKREYGELVIACDNKKYWRKQIFPNYKANRKKAREDSGYDWNVIFDTINLLKSELKLVFPYRVLEIEGAEADDIIATLCKHTRDQKILIISGDHDFIQLQKYDNVFQYSPIQKKFIKADRPASEILLEHIIKGDKGDGIPNVLSGDDSFVAGERQKPIHSKKLNEWISDPVSMPHDDVFVRNYQRNQKLIDLSKIPLEIENTIINSFNAYPKKDRSGILDYFIQNRMKNMMEFVEDF
jgi:hypothetical protein